MEESKRCHRFGKVWGAFGWIFIVLALLCMAGLVVSLIMFGLGNEQMFLLGILSGAFTGGAALFGAAGFFAVKRGELWLARERDALERSDGEESFFIGEDTLATFGESGLNIHNKERRVEVPYGEVRFVSVCTRRKPREKGEWSVLMEIPAIYLLKKAKKNEPPVLIQADAKERLCQTLQRHGLLLLGERRKEEEKTKKFTRMRKFDLPDREKRKRALWMLLLGALLTGGGVGLLFYMTAIGAPVIVVGGYIVLRAIASYQRGKRVFAVYREGLYLAELSSRDSFFLKWEEIGSLSAAEAEKQEIIRAECLYGAYDFPRPDGAYEYIKENFPDKCAE